MSDFNNEAVRNEYKEEDVFDEMVAKKKCDRPNL